MKPHQIAVLCGAVVALCACGQKKPEASAPSASAAADAEPAVKREPMLARAAYIDVDTNRLVEGDARIAATTAGYRAIYWSRAKRDDELLAFDHLAAYRDEPDSFKRADLIKANKAPLDSAWAAAQANNHFALVSTRTSWMRVEHYDPKARNFKFALNWEVGQALSWNKPAAPKTFPDNWSLWVLGGSLHGNAGVPPPSYQPRDEAEARAIEARLAAAGDPSGGAVDVQTVLLGHTVGSAKYQLSNYVGLFVVDAVIAISPADQQPLFTLDMRQLGQLVPVKNDDAVTMLELPKPHRAMNVRAM
jgi:hypothetical protein